MLNPKLFGVSDFCNDLQSSSFMNMSYWVQHEVLMSFRQGARGGLGDLAVGVGCFADNSAIY